MTLHDARGEAIHTIRYAVMAGGDASQLCMSTADDVLHLLARKPEMRLTLLCDGAPEVWKLLDAEFDEESFGKRPIRRLVDFWHLIEKLTAAPRVMIPDESKRKQTLARWRMTLLNKSDAASEIRGEIKVSGKEHVRLRENVPVHDAITYLTNRAAADRMNYAGARRLHLPIGSGNVEATSKSLFTVRLKRSGARWKRDSGEHVVTLRTLALSDRWDRAMDLTLAVPTPSLPGAA